MYFLLRNTSWRRCCFSFATLSGRGRITRVDDRPCFFFRALMLTSSPGSEPLTLLFRVLFRRRSSHPKKLKPSVMCWMLVFFSLMVRPRCDKNTLISGMI